MIRRIYSIKWILIAFSVLGIVGLSHAISYVESSTGLRPPRFEGGNTEFEMADINQDGNIDLLSIGDHGSPYVNTDQHGIMVWFGDGRGNWTNYMNGNFGYGGIAVGDVNNDGRLDVGYGMHHNYSTNDFGDQVIEVALGDGTGRNWVAWDDSLAQQGQNWGMFATDFGDIDNDGYLDVGSVSFGADDGLWIYRNLRSGTWRMTFGFAGGNSTMFFTFGDINKDGNLDMAVGHQNGTVYFGDGLGGFVRKDRNLPPPGTSGLSGIALGDVNNDGSADLSFTNRQGGVEVWTYSVPGDSWVKVSRNLPAAGGAYATQICDMDVDGNQDITTFGRCTTKVYKGDGGGNWNLIYSHTTLTPGSFSAFTVGGDVDHNGYPDIVQVAGEGTANYVRVFKEASIPTNLSIRAVFPHGGEKFFGGSVRFIDWISAVPGGVASNVRLELSTTGPAGPYSQIAGNLPNNGRYQWTVPRGVNSNNCYVRYKVSTASDSALATTLAAFTIGVLGGLGDSHASSLVRDGLFFVNPVSREVDITFHLGSSSKVRVSLVNIVGQEIRVLSEGFCKAGMHRIRFRPGGLAAGTYFCRLQGRDLDLMRPMVIIK